MLLLIALAGCGGDHRRPGLPVAPARPTLFPPPLPHIRHPEVDRRRPNIVFVLTDDLSTDLVRYMPAVQALERRGMTFDRYIVSDSLCCPSRASIFTGRLPHDTGVFTNIPPDGGIYAWAHHRDGLRTFAVPLHARGYRVALFGKYLNGYRADHDRVAPGWTDWAATAEGYNEFGYNLNINGLPVHYGIQSGDYLTDVLADRGARFIDTSAARREPFFLELATFAPHRPAIPAPRDAHLFPAARAPRGPAFNRPSIAPPAWLAGRPPLAPTTVERIDQDFRSRARSVVAVDDLITKLEAHLRATDQARNTYFVFSSDNGYHMGEHRLLPGKLTAFDTDIRAPLVVVGPGIGGGTRSGALVQNTDLAATFEQLGGIAPRPGLDGRSLVPLLHGHRPADWRRVALVEHHHPAHSHRDPDLQTGESGDPPSYAALRGRWFTYVEYDNGEREYYDDRGDPDQLFNRFILLTPAARARLHRELAVLVRCHGAAQCASTPPPSDSAR
jgi:arylsulfatase A-like enzyme